MQQDITRSVCIRFGLDMFQFKKSVTGGGHQLTNIDENITSSGREEGDPSPMGYGRRGPSAYRNGNGGGLGATPGSQRYVQPTVKDKHGVNSFLVVI